MQSALNRITLRTSVNHFLPCDQLQRIHVTQAHEKEEEAEKNCLQENKLQTSNKRMWVNATATHAQPHSQQKLHIRK